MEKEKGKIMTEHEAKEILTKIARSDIGEFMTFGTVRNEAVKVAKGQPSRTLIIDIHSSTTVDTELVEEFSLGGDGMVRLKMYDKLAALDMLCRYFQMEKR
jgi:hypothetical protein